MCDLVYAQSGSSGGGWKNTISVCVSIPPFDVGSSHYRKITIAEALNSSL